ncbi:MAG: 1,4-dihydroxy-6-naphthoate synthase [Chitinophagaceae bacterium]
MKITLGFSPCPNDTFIFDALVNNKIDTGNLKFEVILEDVETLNQLALKSKLDISKISYGVLPLLLDDYIVLNSGSALGNGVGPILISSPIQISKDQDLRNPIKHEQFINSCTVAIPGEHTTAHMLFNLAFPDAKNKIFLRYDEIEDFILKKSSQVVPGEGRKSVPTLRDLEGAVAGVIIHENRFTYEQNGLVKIMDLGEFWEQKTQLPIPLGGIVARRDIESSAMKEINELIRKSIEYSFANYPYITDYVRKYSQEMEEDIIRKHIDLYVNDYSIDLGEKGKSAIREFLRIIKIINTSFNKPDKNIFLN